MFHTQQQDEKCSIAQIAAKCGRIHGLHGMAWHGCAYPEAVF